MTPGVSTTTPAMSTGLAAGRASTRSPRDPQCRGPIHITIAALPLIAEWIQGAGAGVEAGPGATTLAAGEILTADQAVVISIAPRCRQTLALFLLLLLLLLLLMVMLMS